MCVRGARAAESPSRREAAEGPRYAPGPLLEVSVQGASLHRSFAKVGTMDPYAILLADGREVYRTAPHKWSHRQPTWSASCDVESGRAGTSVELTVQVWDKNHFHKDVFCGSVTVPLQSDMVAMAPVELLLTKRGEITGTLRISVRPQRALLQGKSNLSLPSLLGANTDDIKPAAAKEANNKPAFFDDQDIDDLVVLSERLAIAEAEAEAEAGGAATPEPAAAPPPAKPPAAGLAGEWQCVATDGMDEFLKATGVGMLQRQIAAKARWPAWEFSVSGGRVHLLNHSAMGDLREEINLSGSYVCKDGRGNEMTCRAEWEEGQAADGGVLRIRKSGAVGDWTEERRLSGDGLIFVLRDSKTGASWGRTFKRA